MELFYVTSKGLEYFAKTATGKILHFTKGKFGNGTYTGTVTALIDLVNPLGELAISNTSVKNNSVTVTTQFSNSVNGEILDPFYLKEIGLFAKILNSDGTDDTSNPETLVAYASAEGTGDRIPGVLTEFIINFPCTISNTENVTVTTGSLIYVTADELNDHKDAAILDHPDGSVTTNKLSNFSVTTAKLGANVVTTSKLADGAVTTGKIEDGAITEDKIDGNVLGPLYDRIENKADGIWTSNEINRLDGKIDALPIKSLDGETVSPTYGESVVVGNNGTLIIGDLRAREYSSILENIPDSGNIATGAHAVAMGSATTATGAQAVAMGNTSKATAYCSFAMGHQAHATGRRAIAMGKGASADGENAIAMGQYVTATGENAIAMGCATAATGVHSVGIGYSVSPNDFGTAIGKNNKAMTAGTRDGTGGDAFVIGNGVSASPSNAFRVTFAGRALGLSAFGSSGADYAEYFEWQDGNPDNEDRRGLFVTLDGNKIRKATAEDTYILGVISGNPSFIGDIQSELWHGQWLTDVFGEKLTEIVEIPETKDEITGEVKPAHTEERWILNPDFDPEKEYISRDQRKEWAAVGLVGKLVVIDNGTCEANGYCQIDEDGKVTKAETVTPYRVMERLDDNHIRIFIK